jgi:hypothetical protein
MAPKSIKGIKKRNSLAYGEVLWMVMKPIAVSCGGPSVFVVGRNGARRWLSAGYAHPVGRWRLSNRVVFRVRN